MALKRAYVDLWPAIQEMSSVRNLSGEAHGPALIQTSSAMRLHQAIDETVLLHRGRHRLHKNFTCPSARRKGPAAHAVDNGRLARWRRAGRKSPIPLSASWEARRPNSGLACATVSAPTPPSSSPFSFCRACATGTPRAFFPRVRERRSGCVGLGVAKGVRCGEANLAGG
jgi:hypothetical protein